MGDRPQLRGLRAAAKWRDHVMYEGAPTWPEADRFWRIVEKYQVSIFYTAPTAIRAFMRLGEQWPRET